MHCCIASSSSYRLADLFATLTSSFQQHLDLQRIAELSHGQIKGEQVAAGAEWSNAVREPRRDGRAAGAPSPGQISEIFAKSRIPAGAMYRPV